MEMALKQFDNLNHLVVFNRDFFETAALSGMTVERTTEMPGQKWS
jgi:hypothetical protein